MIEYYRGHSIVYGKTTENRWLCQIYKGIRSLRTGEQGEFIKEILVHDLAKVREEIDKMIPTDTLDNWM